jgi:hypothetical protein
MVDIDQLDFFVLLLNDSFQSGEFVLFKEKKWLLKIWMTFFFLFYRCSYFIPLCLFTRVKLKREEKYFFSFIKNCNQCKSLFLLLTRQIHYFSFCVNKKGYSLLVVFVQDNVTTFSVDKLGQPLFNSWICLWSLVTLVRGRAISPVFFSSPPSSFLC